MQSLEINEFFYSGTSGLALPIAKQDFPLDYRNKSRLTYYASLFNSIEINSTFKKLPMQRTIEKWAMEVGDHFMFTFKLPQSITHSKGLHFPKEDVYRFFELINHIGDKKGCILVQFPGKLAASEATQLEELLYVLHDADKGTEWRKAVEFRNASWFQDDTYTLLQKYNAALVFHDLPPAMPSRQQVTGGFVYIRFHGTEKGYRGSYPDEVLSDYARQINAWHADGKPVYVYFNNTLGNAANNLITLNRMLTNAE